MLLSSQQWKGMEGLCNASLVHGNQMSINVHGLPPKIKILVKDTTATAGHTSAPGSLARKEIPSTSAAIWIDQIPQDEWLSQAESVWSTIEVSLHLYINHLWSKRMRIFGICLPFWSLFASFLLFWFSTEQNCLVTTLFLVDPGSWCPWLHL